MPNLKKIERMIPSFYRQKTLDVMLFAHVYTLCFSGKFKMKIIEAVELFEEIYDIDPDTYPTKTALKNYARMKDKYLWRYIVEHKNLQ